MSKDSKYLTVTDVNRYIEKKYVNDPYLKKIYIKGEVSNCKLHTNGTLYFSIKDSNTKMNALKFRAKVLDIKEGDSVLVTAELNFYFPYGEARLIVSEIEKDSIGDLYRRLLDLKEKLNNEGLFDTSLKKKITRFPESIAVVTAKTGAAVQDITKTIYRRYPLAKLNLYSSLVQGPSAIADIVEKLGQADRAGNDLIILARGGGSIEDLWAFNSEEVVRAIFRANTPIITGIGHETDTTLADYAADKYASTPTAAAELATSVTISDLQAHFKATEIKIRGLINQKISSNMAQVEGLANSYQIKNFANNFSQKAKDIESYKTRIELLLQNKFDKKISDFIRKKESFLKIDIVEKESQKLQSIIEKLEHNSPLNILKKGYALVKDKDNKRLTSVKSVEVDSDITIDLKDGVITAKVVKIEEEKTNG
ncbi:MULTISPECIES: exodeoxyribonuclease VII large subunit [unclassified Gemella]|uniref:exodeoxyribonuclease VII large subunit n=1 Tax=unclassified Gemella TaxID=2624949 RepID=UPI001074576B|nr:MULTISPECIES: exodeoxyribonuclease VII large subunit [unclassified Gemella]MBF0710698.1 exodeoxyribonuclease VII large subunit [Gemella sp. GL1.1]MBF0746733.1 exodeoxyribonuclease VII large subunit [Gemella sp. 19428wG2_WT2a]NYS28042.1 exodeoxyribonuclease VII large subunit [Gemella sp. GL1]TFU60081.1 exodeoxyribonuclease VII large subunit [Gemella sp. WT2a]